MVAFSVPAKKKDIRETQSDYLGRSTENRRSAQALPCSSWPLSWPHWECLALGSKHSAQCAPFQTGENSHPANPAQAPNPHRGELRGETEHLSLPEVVESGLLSSSGVDPTRPHRGHCRASVGDGPNGALVTALPGKGGRDVRKGSHLNHQVWSLPSRPPAALSSPPNHAEETAASIWVTRTMATVTVTIYI